MGVVGVLMLLVVGLGLSAFFSGTETALTALPISRVEALLQLGGVRGWAWRRWRERPHRVLVTILIGNTAVNIGMSAIATQATIELVGDRVVGIAAGLMTLAVLVFGEVTPKTLARVDPEVAARKAIVPIGLLDWLLTPLVVPLLGLSQFVARLRNVPLNDAPAASSPEDLRFLISLSRQEGHLSEQQESMLEAVLRFETTLLREVQIPRTDIVFLRHDSTLREVRATVRRTGYSRYPVLQDRDDNVVGILMVKDLLRPGSEKEPWTSLLKPALFVPEGIKVVDLLREMRGRRTHVAITIDEYGNVAGLVSLEDLVELIVGDIRDEHDTAEPMWRAEGPGSWLVRGSLPLTQLARLCDHDFDAQADYTSVAGLILRIAGRIPSPGETFEHEGLRFSIAESSTRRIDKVRVSLVEQER